MKHFISLLLCLSFTLCLFPKISFGKNANSVISCSVVSGYPFLYEETELDAKVLEDIKYSEMFNKQLDKLFEHWGNKYPEYYAGAFIEHLKLTLLVTCSPDTVREEICSATGNNDIIIEQVPYSYNYLVSCQDEVLNKISVLQKNKAEYSENIIECGIREKNNKIEITINKQSSKTIETIEKYFSEYEMISVLVDNSPCQEISNVTAGTDNYVKNATAGGYCTISFCASRVNSAGVTEKGFVTAGHAGSLNDVMKISTTNVGKVSWRKHSGNCDALFINMNDYPNSGYVRSSILSTNYLITSCASVGAEGTTYVMHGKASGIVSGTVNKKSTSYTYSGTTFTDAIKMNLTAIAHDSGAPLVKTTSGNRRAVIGIAAYKQGSYTYFTKASNIMNSMNGSLF
ncbi:MAG: hypothetical protein J5778_00450 [Clostridiales bacterium]|nr:hypothetical protein [Clostridiales bacterium]